MILVQQSQVAYFDTTVDPLKDTFEIIIASDDALGEELNKNKKLITGLLIFELTDGANRVTEIARNERYSNPMVPIAYVGAQSLTQTLPFGTERFSPNNTVHLSAYLTHMLKVKILVIEDDEGVRDLLALTLRKYFDVSLAEDGSTGLEQLESGNIDLVILDLMLPDISGEDIFIKMKSDFPETAIVIITAFDTEETELKYKYSGAIAYIKKPFLLGNREFRQTIIEALVRKHQIKATNDLILANESNTQAWNKYREKMCRYLLE